MRGLPSLIFALAAMAAAPAVAQPGAAPHQTINADCVWAGVPPSARSAMAVNATSIDDLDKRAEAQLGEFIPAIAKACHVTLDQAGGTQIGLILTAKLLETWASTQLKARFGVDPGPLSASWRQVPADLRAGIGANAGSGANATPEQIKAMEGMAVTLGISTKEGFTLVATYAAGRAMFEAAGGTG